MDLIFTHQEDREPIRITNHSFKLCLPLVKRSGSDCFNPFSILGYWVSKSARKFCHRARFTSGFCCGGLEYKGMVVNNSTFCSSPVFLEQVAMETEEKCDGFGNAHKVFDEKSAVGESGSGGSSSDLLTSEATGHDGQSHDEESSSSSSTLMGWPLHRTAAEEDNFDDGGLERQVSSASETEMMKERFSKLLLGEDMSGCGNGVSTALAISNAITNLCATLFGQLWRLEPLAPERKAMWRREMEWLLCVSNHIVELIPICQTFPDGSKLEIMTCRPRSDLYVNLPALRKLDNMLLDILESFVDSEFRYVDQGILAAEADGSSSFRKVVERQEDKWWLPIPRVPSGGLSEASRRQLQHKRDCTNQILKAAMAINSVTLADMDVPNSYLEALPKNGRASLGEAIYRYIASDEFSPVYLLECLDMSSEHQAIEMANRVEAAMYAWRKGTTSKPTNNNNNSSRSSSKSSWEMLKELVIDADKSELFAERAESLLFCLKQQFPNLPQTSLDMSKIQFNKDVGKAILESYSRVLESLAFNIVARIDDLLYVDDLTKHSDQIPGISVAHNSSNRIQFSVPFPSSPYSAAFMKPSPKGGTRSPIPECGIVVKNVSIDKGSLIEKLNLVGEIVEESEKSEFSKGDDY